VAQARRLNINVWRLTGEISISPCRIAISGDIESHVDRRGPAEAMAKDQIMAAGGIVLRREQPPRIAVVRLRKRDEWVLPKGKLDDGETPRDAAKREVLEETGHNVTVHEFLGTLVVDTGARSKVVHYWRMEANGEQTRPLMNEIRAVDWLPLDQAVERLSRSHEKTFLEAVGPYALAGLIRRTKAKSAEEERAQTVAGGKQAVRPAAKEIAAAGLASARKRRSRAPELAETMLVPTSVETAAAPSTSVVAEAAHSMPSGGAPEPVETTHAGEHAAGSEAAGDVTPAHAVDIAEPAPTGAAAAEVQRTETPEEVTPPESSDVARVHAVAARIKSMTTESASRIAPIRQQEEAPHQPAAEPDAAAEPAVSQPAMSEAKAEMPDRSEHSADPPEPPRRTLAQKLRGWFGRAA
jgi:8-oxo-dGTP diphosphatase